MATYAIGDIQGCYDEFQALLRTFDFDDEVDRLWLVGDLVNRGPKNLELLRWLVDHDPVVTAVLGNHDVHLLRRAAGLSEAKARDTLDDVLDAPDRKSLITWLRHRPLLVRNSRHVLVHAGLLPSWTLDVAEAKAHAIENLLRGPDWKKALDGLRREKAKWKKAWGDRTELEQALSVLTAIRVVDVDRRPSWSFNGPPNEAPKSELPWFDAPHPRGAETIVFGHWAALGLMVRDDVIALDSGCVWGQRLTAVRLEDRKVFQVNAGQGAS